jgi:hypothetical protein
MQQALRNLNQEPTAMTTALVQPLSQARTDELIREAAEHRPMPRPQLEPLWSPLVIRLATAGDQKALKRLSELDSRPTPNGTTLIAEQRGSLVAAVSLHDGDQIADPFIPTADITDLLRVRARQLTRSAHPRSWIRHVRHVH